MNCLLHAIGGNDAAVRVHPQFLHANATSHKWALGALAELLDNSVDEVSAYILLFTSFYKVSTFNYFIKIDKLFLFISVKQPFSLSWSICFCP